MKGIFSETSLDLGLRELFSKLGKYDKRLHRTKGNGYRRFRNHR